MPDTPHDPYAALHFRDYGLFTIGRNASVIGSQMLTVALGWELYLRTDRAMSLGLLGLAHAIPVILLAIPAGHLADRLDRRRIAMVAQVGLAICSIGLAIVSRLHAPIPYIYLCVICAATVGAMSGPAKSALLPQLVPPSVFANAVTWGSSFFQLSSVIGPAIGGLAIARMKSIWPVYVADAGCELVFLVLIAALHTPYATARASGPTTLKSLAAGIQFVREKKIILATITLDLFAVLLGGAVTLLPVYARDILHVGASGLGWLRAAPSAGALIMALALAHLPPLRRAGASMLGAVAMFGAATIVFGFSRFFWLSLLMLFITGAVDNVSVVIRNTLVQVLTPDEMRGRVSAVNNVFISSSNDLGGFESGTVAQFFGPVFSVVSGGIGTIIVVIAVALIWPQLRDFGSLTSAGDSSHTPNPVQPQGITLSAEE